MAQPADAAAARSSRRFSSRSATCAAARGRAVRRAARIRARRAWAMRCRPMSGTPPSCRRTLRVNVRIVDAGGVELAQGRDLAQLRTQLGEAAQLQFRRGRARRSSAPASGRWDFGDLPDTLSVVRDGRRLTGYPALVDARRQRRAAAATTRARRRKPRRAPPSSRLIAPAAQGRACGAGKRSRRVSCRRRCSSSRRFPADALLARCARARCATRAFLGDDPLPRSERAFAEQVKRARTRLPAVVERRVPVARPRSPPNTTALSQRHRQRCRRRTVAPRAPTMRRAARSRWSIRASSPPRPVGAARPPAALPAGAATGGCAK